MWIVEDLVLSRYHNSHSLCDHSLVADDIYSGQEIHVHQSEYYCYFCCDLIIAYFHIRYRLFRSGWRLEVRLEMHIWQCPHLRVLYRRLTVPYSA